jgi:hypothetical protein
MKRTFCLLLALAFISCREFVQEIKDSTLAMKQWDYYDQAPGIPFWSVGGVHGKDYRFTLDTIVFAEGKASGCISLDSASAGYGSFIRSDQPEPYHNRRLEVTASIKSEITDATGWSGMWLRADNVNDGTSEFAHMEDRKIMGTNNWKDYTIAVDVNSQTTGIVFGLILSGRGKVWIDNVRYKAIDTLDKTKPLNDKAAFIRAPENLDFETVAGKIE